jgi:hypothetical protein
MADSRALSIVLFPPSSFLLPPSSFLLLVLELRLCSEGEKEDEDEKVEEDVPG